MSGRVLPTLARGALAGVAATTVQTLVGKGEEMLLLPPREDADIAPRLVKRLGEAIGVEPSNPTKWALGTAFHFGYGAFWGMTYAALRERRPLHPVVGGALLGGLIYAVTFPRWGGAVQTGTERRPGRRSDGMEVVAASVCLSFGVVAAFANEALRDVIR